MEDKMDITMEKKQGDSEEKKPGLAILIASKMKEKNKSEDGGSDYAELAQMIMDDIKDGDAEKFAKDLKSFVQMCAQ
jgi:hypothetical protein